MIPRLHVPLLEPHDVVRHLGKQERHWKEGRSAHALAHVWFEKNGLLESISSIFLKHPGFNSVELIDAFMERQVDLGSAGRPSQADLLAIVGLNDRLAVLAVEGKAGEPFGDLVSDWLDGSPTKSARLEALSRTLAFDAGAIGGLRYQLLHRAASAIYEAKRYRTDVAAMLIHDFSGDRNGVSDFSAFLSALGANEPEPHTLSGPFQCEGISLYLGWVEDKAPVGNDPLAYLAHLQDYAARLSKWCERVSSWCDQRKTALSGKIR